MSDRVVLSSTESVCPECLEVITARRVRHGDRIMLCKDCPAHGHFETLIWSGDPPYESWGSPNAPSYPDLPGTQSEKGCPLDCGLCPEHRQHTCCALVEVTGRCNLRCPVCYANAGDSDEPDPDMDTIRNWYERLLAAGGPCVVQLSGGEPTLRDDLPEIIALGRSLGFDFIQVNTNGLRLARDPAYVRALRDAGLGCVFLQFDAIADEVYVTLRGRPLLAGKLRAVQQCSVAGIGVVLVPTLVRGVSLDQIGGIIDFAIRHVPSVRAVHFQPISYFGRYPERPSSGERITIPEIIGQIELQTEGRIMAENIKPPAGQNSYCSFNGNFVLMPDGELKPWTFHDSKPSCCGPRPPPGQTARRARQFVAHYWSAPGESRCRTSQGPSLGEWDEFIERAASHTLCISGMAFQDAWSLDLDRLRDCCVHAMHPDGRLIPFCAYNLTGASGRSLYRR